MVEGEPGVKNEDQQPEVLDISDRVLDIVNDPDKKAKSIEVIEMCRQPDIKNAPEVAITMNYMGEDWAKWAKAWKEEGSGRQKRDISIRATKEQRDKSANVFASGVKWIEVDEHGNEVKKEE